MSAGRGWAGQRLALDSPVLTTGPGQHRGGGPGSQALPAGRPHSQRSGSESRGPRSPPAPRCGTPARSGSSLWGRGCLRPSSGVPPTAAPSPGLRGRQSLAVNQVWSPSRLHPLTHHRTRGSRCPGGAGRGTGTGWSILAGGTGCGPPGGGRGEAIGAQPRGGNSTHILTTHSLDIVMSGIVPPTDTLSPTGRDLIWK